MTVQKFNALLDFSTLPENWLDQIQLGKTYLKMCEVKIKIKRPEFMFCLPGVLDMHSLCYFLL